MNDLQQVTDNCDISMCADDTHLSAALKGSSDISIEIIPDFLKICDWLQANKLSLNILKTEYMIIGTEKFLIQLGPIPKIKVGNRYLDRVTKTKSLGLIIDDNLHWGDHIDYVCSKVKRYIGIIERTKDCLPRSSFIQLYRSLVEPYFRYGNTVSDLCNTTLIDKLKL